MPTKSLRLGFPTPLARHFVLSCDSPSRFLHPYPYSPEHYTSHPLSLSARFSHFSLIPSSPRSSRIKTHQPLSQPLGLSFTLSLSLFSLSLAHWTKVIASEGGCSLWAVEPNRSTVSRFYSKNHFSQCRSELLLKILSSHFVTYFSPDIPICQYFYLKPRKLFMQIPNKSCLSAHKL